MNKKPIEDIRKLGDDELDSVSGGVVVNIIKPGEDKAESGNTVIKKSPVRTSK